MVYAGPTFWPLERAAEVLRIYRQLIVSAPEDISGFFAFLIVPPAPIFPEHLHGKAVCGVVWCCTCSPEEADKALKPIRSFGPPTFDFVGLMPYPTLQSFFDPIYPPGLQWYWRADFVKELNDAAVALHVQHGSRVPTMHSTMHLYPINGAPHRVDKNDTPFSYRDSNWAEVIVGVDPDPANNPKIIS